MPSDEPVTVDPSDRAAVRRNLERFASPEAVSGRSDGALVAEFRGVTHVTVRANGRIETGMPLHEFAGEPERIVFDHEHGELRVEDADGDTSYTFRRP